MLVVTTHLTMEDITEDLADTMVAFIHLMDTDMVEPMYLLRHGPTHRKHTV